MKGLRISKSFALATAGAMAFAMAGTTQADVITHWNFNAPTGTSPASFESPLAADSGDGVMTWTFATVTDFTGRAENIVPPDEPGRDIAFSDAANNNGQSFTVSVSTVGWENIQVSFVQRSTSTGFQSMGVEYTTDGSSFLTFGGSPFPLEPDSEWRIRNIDFSTITAVNDNANFAVRITLDGASGGGNTRIDNLRVDGTDIGGVITPNFVTYSSAPDKILVDFATAPTVTVEAADFSLTGETVTVDSVANVSGDLYELTLSGAASGDLSLDTLTYNNGTDNEASLSLYAGIVSLETIRQAVLADGNFNPSITGGFVSVQGVVIENIFDAGNGANITIQEGDFGITLRDATAFDLPAAVQVGDEIVFAGNFGQFNGLQQLQAGPGLVDTVSTGNTVEPAVFDWSTASSADWEAVESTLITLEGATFENGGTALPDDQSFGAGINEALVGTDAEVRFDGDLASVFANAVLPTGPVDVTGILGQFDNANPRDSGYQLFPRSLSDLDFPDPTDVESWELYH